MKLFGLILSLFVLQAIALPTAEDPNKPEHLPLNERVDYFRERINYLYTRFQVFYDLVNDAMSNYRLAHVELISRLTQDLMREFGVAIEVVRQHSFKQTVESEQCRVAAQEREANSRNANTAIQNCSIRTNNTLTEQLGNVFYPTFASIQASVSAVPLFVSDALSRGNVFEDDLEIVEYLESQYAVIRMQWLGAVSQLFRWETNRVNVEGDFYIEEMQDCLGAAVISFLNEDSRIFEKTSC